MISERTLFVGLETAVNSPIVPVGILKLQRRGVLESGEFAYGQRYVQSAQAFALNEDYLPLKSTYCNMPEKRLRDGGALPLTFRDALPDSWGRKVLEVQYGNTLSDVDVLLLTNADRVGAMVFAAQLPIQADWAEAELISLDVLAQAVHQLAFSLDMTPAMKRLLLRDGSLGGARPKATFIQDGMRWLAKFPARGDDHDVELLEAATLVLARLCGIEVVDFKVQPVSAGHALLLRRFDRDGLVGNERRIHFLSASAVLNVPYESSDGSYVEFAQILRRLSIDPARDLDQLFRRMVFNVLIDNSDDHVKNHGVLQVGTHNFRLSPAFDVVPQLNNIGYQQLAILPGRFESSLNLVRQAAPHFGVSLNKCNEIIMLLSTLIADNFEKILVELDVQSTLIECVNKSLKKQAQLISQ